MSNEVFYVRDRRQPYHYTIDNEVFDLHLGVYALGVYNALARHVSYDGQDVEQAALSQKQLAQELCCSVTKVKEGLKKLLEHKLVAVERIKGQANLYVLLEVNKTEPQQRKYQRRGVSQNTPNRTGSADRQNAPTPGQNTPTPGQNAPRGSRNAPDHKNRKRKARKGLRGKRGALKSKNENENLEAADAAKYSDELQDFNKRVFRWHEQNAGITKCTYDAWKISKWLGPHIRHLGLERVKEIFEHVANGVNPYVDAFWKALKEEREKKDVHLAKVEQDMLEDVPAAP